MGKFFFCLKILLSLSVQLSYLMLPSQDTHIHASQTVVNDFYVLSCSRMNICLAGE